MEACTIPLLISFCATSKKGLSILINLFVAPQALNQPPNWTIRFPEMCHGHLPLVNIVLSEFVESSVA